MKFPKPQGASAPPISPDRVRYIKLGAKGAWERDCLETGTVRFGFGTGRPEIFALCLEGRWHELTKLYLSDGKDKGTATRFTNEVRLFFEDKGSTLWITFIGDHLSWGFLEPGEPTQHEDGHRVRRKVSGGWRQHDLHGEPLTKDRLSGALTKLAAYRGTSCEVDVADYVVRRINGLKIPEVERALLAVDKMKICVLEMMRLLGPKDFETLVDLVFSTSGWRRQGIIGKTQKTLDLDLILPSTEECAFVQVKSETNQAELDDYVSRLDEFQRFHKMFFVYHTGKCNTDDERVVVIGPEKLAEMVLDAGLATWLIRKVS